MQIVFLEEVNKLINFVIVEDNDMHRKQIKKSINKYMMRNNIEYDILEFSDFTEELEKTINCLDGSYIYILDYEMPSADALDISRKIREVDWTSPIIINSVHAKLAFETFKQRLQILDFIDKLDSSESDFFSLLDTCLLQIDIKPKTFRFKIRGVDYNIDYNKILYIYRDTYARKLVIVTNNNEYKMNKNIKDIIKVLDDRFKITHKACIVNMDRVEALVWKENKIIFDNKMEIYLLSKTHKKELECDVVI